MEQQLTSEQSAKQLKDLSEQSAQLEQHYQSRFQHLSKDLETLNRELRLREQQIQEKQLEVDRLGFVQNGEWQKERALNEQQQKFLKDKLDEAERREKQLEQSLQAVRN